MTMTMTKGYVFEVRNGIFYSYLFATTAKEARAEFLRLNGSKATSCEKRSGRVTAEAVKNTVINI